MLPNVASLPQTKYHYGAVHNLPVEETDPGYFLSIGRAGGEPVSAFDKFVNVVYRYALASKVEGADTATFDPHAGHDHGRRLANDFEWVGAFPLSADTHKWSMQAATAGENPPAYADATMRLVIFPTSTTPTADNVAGFYETNEAAANTLITSTDTSCVEVEDSETMTKAVNAGSCYELHTGSGDDSEFTIDTTGLSGMVVYAQHVPIEFERDKHYLYDASGNDVEPVEYEEFTKAEMEEDIEDMEAYYEDSGTSCSSATSLTPSHGLACAKLPLQDGTFDSNFAINLPAEHSKSMKIFQFMAFFTGPKSFEWGGVFNMAGASHKWFMQKVDGAYADPSMRVVIIPTSVNPTADDIENNEELAHTLMSGNVCPEIEDTETITPVDGGSCFELHTGTGDDSTYNIDSSNIDAMAIFAQHVPTEFERDKHYLADASDADVEPIAQEPEPGAHAHGRRLEEDAHAGHDHGGGGATGKYADADFLAVFQVKDASKDEVIPAIVSETNKPVPPHDDSFPQDKNLGLPILASLIVNLVTLTGVIFLIPGVKAMLTNAKVNEFDGRANDEKKKELELAETGTANGTALGAETVGTVKPPVEFDMPSSMVMLTSAFSAGAILSCAYLLVLPEAFLFLNATEDGGIFWKNGTSVLAGLLFPFLLSTIGAIIYPVTAENSTAMRITFGVLVGDFFHNFADGCFIGVAFMNCDSTFGWTVAVSSILHEIAQEIADFFTLTALAGLTPLKALSLNFLSGFSVMIGAIVVITSGMSDNTLGYILAIGGGIYVQIGATECLPRAFDLALSPTDKTKSMIMFAVGAILIGLVLLDHEHCEVGGSHEGHNH